MASTINRHFSSLAALISLWSIHAAKAGEPSVLRLTNGDFATGQLVDSPQSDRLAWNSAAFQTPLQIAINGVKSVNFPIPEKAPKPAGTYAFELAGGDVLFGSLISFSDTEAVIDVPPMGRLHLDKSVVRRIYRSAGGDELLYVGPNGLHGWETSGPLNAWRDEAGHLSCKQAGAVIRRDFKLPPMVKMDFELSWSNKPDFEFALATDGKSTEQSFRLDVWEGDLVALRATDKNADLAKLRSVKAGPANVQLSIYLDQVHERMLVFSSSGEQLANLKVSSGNEQPEILGGIQLKNRGSGVCLERLRISQWKGETPRLVQADKTRVHQTDGTIVYGQLKSYDPARHAFEIDDGTSVVSLDEDRVLDLILTHETEPVVRSMRMVYTNGQQISGDFLKVENGQVWLQCPGIKETIQSPVDGLQTILFLTPPADAPELPGRPGRVEVDGTVLKGCLVDSRETDATCLNWHPRFGMASSPLVRGIPAQVIYVDPPQPVTQQAQPADGTRVRMLVNGVPTSVPKAPKAISSKNAIPVLHLRCGDKLPCTAVSIDEQGVTFQSTMTDATFVKHDQIKVLELIPDAPPIKISKTKKDRLLMLPRMQRDSPPTQLIRSTSGDYLRGRLLAMTENEVKLELRLEQRAIPRDTIARIIWFHPDELEGTEHPPATHDESAATRVQAVPHDGNRLTFHAEKFEGTVLSGRSDLLGVCRVEVEKLDQLLIGASIEHAASSLVFHEWKLRQAIDPLGSAEESGGDSEGSEGKDAALVGKPAPNIELDLLDGTKFRLADYKNKVVVLDFWASWCGPCLQAMPQVDAVAHEFVDQNVVLVAINLEEGPDKVKAALDRLKLQTTVALDRNGRVSERYGVTSIPQTVIIDREGKVARLFVGGGARFGDQVRTALQNVLSDTKEKNEGDKPPAKSDAKTETDSTQ